MRFSVLSFKDNRTFYSRSDSLGYLRFRVTSASPTLDGRSGGLTPGLTWSISSARLSSSVKNKDVSKINCP